MLRTVLVVDDDDINRRLLDRILRNDYKVIKAGDGLEALELLHEYGDSISAVLLDIVMPRLDGYGVLAAMREDPELMKIPVIVTTGNTSPDTEVKALSLGAHDFITKPYNPDVIRRRLWNMIDLRETALVAHVSQRDELTGILNRRAFFDISAKMISEKPAGFYMMAGVDIENFKVINDRYGTEKGDLVLKHVANCLDSCCTTFGGICSRISADNFAMLYPREYADSSMLEDNHREASSPPCLDRQISIRIGRYHVDDLSLSTNAMYDRASLAEDSIRGKYHTRTAQYTESMREHLIREQQIVNEMYEALESDRFEPWFQPQYNHATGALVGAEALVRWRRLGESGYTSPGEFIPVFERNGFIYDLDKYIWERVCIILRRWLDEGRNPLPVSVNISRIDLISEDFYETITGLVEKYHLPVDLLRLEVTESAFSESTKQIIHEVKKLASYGFTIEIDDFGSGYSSLNTLKDVPAAILKLDMAFLESSEDTQRGGNIVESVVRMSKWLNMSVIAEGVETQQQADYLKSIGCMYVQGYLYAKPMPLAEYEKLARTAPKESKMTELKTVKNLDNNSFWDPASMDTLIFNSYVGGACIYEYHKGNIELLRATDKYAQVIGSAGMTVEDALKLNWTRHIDEDTLRAVDEALRLSISSQDEVVGEYCFYDLPGCPHETCLRSTMRVIASVDDRYLVYCNNENITAQRKAERESREAAEKLEAIMRNIRGGVTVSCIEEGKFPKLLYANEQFYTQLGYTREQYESEVSSPLDRIHPSEREHVVKLTYESARNNTGFSVQYKIIRRNGSIRWLRTNVTVIEFPGVTGNVQLAVANDITGIVEAEQKERAATERLRAIMAGADSGITAVTTEGETVNFLFANDKYFELTGYTRESYFKEVSNTFALIDGRDRAEVIRKVEQVKDDKFSHTLEYRIRRRDGVERWVRAFISSTAFNDISNPVLLAIITDVTSEKLAEQEMREADEQLSFLNDVAHELLAQPDCDKAIELVLWKLLEYFLGARAYIVESDIRNRSFSNTYEVCAPGVSSEKDRLQELPLDMLASWNELFDKQGYVSIGSVNALDSNSPEKEVLEAQGIRSLIAVPLKRDGRLIGFVGVDDPTNLLSRVERLNALGDYLAVLLTRRDLNAKIESDHIALESLMNDTPGGFVRMRMYKNGTIVPLYFNTGFCRLVNMSITELMDLYGRDSYAGVHPEDLDIVNRAVARILAEGEGHSAPYRLTNGSGGYTRVMFFGRLTKDELGKSYLNVYYTNVVEQNETR